MEYKITLVHSPSGQYLEFYADLDEFNEQDIANDIISNCYVSMEVNND